MAKIRNLLDLSVGFAIGVALASIPAITGPAFAQAPQVLYACVQQSSQQVRIVGAGEPCRQTEVRVQWNVTGPAGPVTFHCTRTSVWRQGSPAPTMRTCWLLCCTQA